MSEVAVLPVIQTEYVQEMGESGQGFTALKSKDFCCSGRVSNVLIPPKEKSCFISDGVKHPAQCILNMRWRPYPSELYDAIQTGVPPKKSKKGRY